MRNLDDMLVSLARMPVPELAPLDDAVMAGLARRRQEAILAPRLMGLAASLALGLGIAGGSISGSSPASAQPGTPAAFSTALAPSTLLDIRP